MSYWYTYERKEKYYHLFMKGPDPDGSWEVYRLGGKRPVSFCKESTAIALVEHLNQTFGPQEEQRSKQEYQDQYSW